MPPPCASSAHATAPLSWAPAVNPPTLCCNSCRALRAWSVTLHCRRHSTCPVSIYRILYCIVLYCMLWFAFARFIPPWSRAVGSEAHHRTSLYPRSRYSVYILEICSFYYNRYRNQVRGLGFKLYSLGTETYGDGRFDLLGFGPDLLSSWVSNMKHPSLLWRSTRASLATHFHSSVPALHPPILHPRPCQSTSADPPCSSCPSPSFPCQQPCSTASPRASPRGRPPSRTAPSHPS